MSLSDYRGAAAYRRMNRFPSPVYGEPEDVMEGGVALRRPDSTTDGEAFRHHGHELFRPIDRDGEPPKNIRY